MRLALQIALFAANGMILAAVTGFPALSWRSAVLIVWSIVLTETYLWIKTHAAPSEERQKQ